jgi:hypothetical protein
LIPASPVGSSSQLPVTSQGLRIQHSGSCNSMQAGAQVSFFALGLNLIPAQLCHTHVTHMSHMSHMSHTIPAQLCHTQVHVGFALYLRSKFAHKEACLHTRKCTQGSAQCAVSLHTRKRTQGSVQCAVSLHTRKRTQGSAQCAVSLHTRKCTQGSAQCAASLHTRKCGSVLVLCL